MKRDIILAFYFVFQTGLSGNFIILSVLYYGGSLVVENSITVGALSAFLLYAAYVGVAIGGLSSFYSEMMKGLGASTRLWELIDSTPSIPLEGMCKLQSSTTSFFSNYCCLQMICFNFPISQAVLSLRKE